MMAMPGLSEGKLGAVAALEKRGLLLYNPRSGGNLGSEVPDTLATVRTALEAAGWRIEPQALTPQTIKLLHETVQSAKPDAVFVMGGDGSIRSVLGCLVDTDIALGIIPCGTMNLLARSLSIPLVADEAAVALANAEIQAIDIASVNGLLFSCHAMLGRSPRLTRLRERMRGNGWLRGALIFFRLLLREVRRNWRSVFRVSDGKKQRWMRAHTLVIANNLVDETEPLGLVKPSLRQGILGLYAVAPRSIWSWVRFLTRWVFGLGREERDTRLFASPAFTVKTLSRTVWISIDGEPVRMQTPLCFESRNGALRVLVPASP